MHLILSMQLPDIRALESSMFITVISTNKTHLDESRGREIGDFRP